MFLQLFANICKISVCPQEAAETNKIFCKLASFFLAMAGGGFHLWEAKNQQADIISIVFVWIDPC